MWSELVDCIYNDHRWYCILDGTHTKYYMTRKPISSKVTCLPSSNGSLVASEKKYTKSSHFMARKRKFRKQTAFSHIVTIQYYSLNENFEINSFLT